MPPKRRKTKRKKRTPKPVILVPLADRALTGGSFMNFIRGDRSKAEADQKMLVNTAKSLWSAAPPELKEAARNTGKRALGTFIRGALGFGATGGLVYDPTEARIREFMERGPRPIKMRTFPFERKIKM